MNDIVMSGVPTSRGVSQVVLDLAGHTLSNLSDTMFINMTCVKMRNGTIRHVSGLQSNRTQVVNRAIYSIFENLKIEGVDALVRHFDPWGAYTYGALATTLEECRVSNVSVKGKIQFTGAYDSSLTWIGGIVGQIYRSEIFNPEIQLEMRTYDNSAVLRAESYTDPDWQYVFFPTVLVGLVAGQASNTKLEGGNIQGSIDFSNFATRLPATETKGSSAAGIFSHEESGEINGTSVNIQLYVHPRDRASLGFGHGGIRNQNLNLQGTIHRLH